MKRRADGPVDVEEDGALGLEVDGERRAFRAGDVVQTRPVE